MVAKFCGDAAGRLTGVVGRVAFSMSIVAGAIVGRLIVKGFRVNHICY